MSAFLPLLGALLLGGAAGADESEAESCLRTKVWDSYSDGWAIRTLTTASLATGKTRSYHVTLYEGNEYRIATCGDSGVRNLDVLLYDAGGEIIARDNTTDREPALTFTPTASGTYYVVLYMRALDAKRAEGGAAMAVIYK